MNLLEHNKTEFSQARYPS